MKDTPIHRFPVQHDKRPRCTFVMSGSPVPNRGKSISATGSDDAGIRVAPGSGPSERVCQMLNGQALLTLIRPRFVADISEVIDRLWMRRCSKTAPGRNRDRRRPDQDAVAASASAHAPPQLASCAVTRKSSAPARDLASTASNVAWTVFLRGRLGGDFIRSRTLHALHSPPRKMALC